MTPPYAPISIYLSSLNGVDTAMLYAHEFQRLQRLVTLCVPSAIARDVHEAVGEKVPILELGTPPGGRLLRRMYRLLIDFGSSLVPGAGRSTVALDLPDTRMKARLVRLVRRIPLKPGPRTINRLAPAMISKHVPPAFPSDHVVVISFPGDPFLLCRRGLTVDTVIDSWDHPVRRTAGYKTRTAVAWNESIGKDWQRFQGAELVAIGPPVKLQYALDRPPRPHADRGVDRIALYPVATSPMAPEWYSDECRFIDAVCRATAQAGWELLLKPKPMTAAGSLDTFAKRYAHVRVCRYHESRGALDYRLDDAYNETRLHDLDQASLVISTVTTFGIDAAAAGVPLVQVDLREMGDIPALAAAAQNYQLETYLYPNTRKCIIRPVSLDEGERDLALLLSSADLEASSEASAALRRWLVGDTTADRGREAARRLTGTQSWTT